jgi:hypothetical protein
MIDMPASQLDGRLVTNTLDKANRAEGVFSLVESEGRILHHAGLIETRQASSFSSEPLASMSTGKQFCTAGFHLLLALYLSTHVLKRILNSSQFPFLNGISTESTFY